MKDREIVLAAILGLVVIECFALSLGFNGQLLRWMTVIIAGLAGYTLPSPFKK